MLTELRVRELGVIADVDIVLGPGLTALTGETGAGKTLIVEALELLLGGRADPTLVRSGADEALVEGRFLVRGGTATEDGAAGDDDPDDDADDDPDDDGGADEVVLGRAVPRNGRSRAFVDGRMAPLALLEEAGRDLVDLYGQHAHQSLLRPSAQRAALDRFAGVDLAPVIGLRRRIAELDRRIAELGGDGRTRARELDLLRFELGEIEAAGIASDDEDERLAAEEEILAGAAALREAVGVAHGRLEGDRAPGAVDLVGEAVEALAHHPALAAHEARLRSVAAELDDAATELRLAAERFEEDPERLVAVRARRQLLRGLVRKHGEVLADVVAFAAASRDRIAELESGDEARAAAEAEREVLAAELAAAEEAVGDRRRAAAPALAREVETHLHELALAGARIEVNLPAAGIADEVELLLGANAGEPALALAKVASGGELARSMLALRLVLTSAPPTLVFDEVDAGIGGEAALALGRALAALAEEHQVLVVTHLPQVAALATRQYVVTKREEAGRTVAEVVRVEGEARVAELSRMLGGRRDSEAARRHAAELLEHGASR